MEIHEQVLKKTTRCNKNFECLNNGSSPCCKVDYCVNGLVLFVEKNDCFYCNYRMNFGDSIMCNCPTRIEIFKKYSI